jgi:hypothetical protein
MEAFDEASLQLANAWLDPEVEAAFGYGQKSRSDRLGVCQI